jgi:hypothetical protein
MAQTEPEGNLFRGDETRDGEGMRLIGARFPCHQVTAKAQREPGIAAQEETVRLWGEAVTDLALLNDRIGSIAAIKVLADSKRRSAWQEVPSGAAYVGLGMRSKCNSSRRLWRRYRGFTPFAPPGHCERGNG